MAQNEDNIEWADNRELNNKANEIIASKITGKWLYIFKLCPFSKKENTRSTGYIIEFKTDSTAQLWYKNQKLDYSYTWKVNESVNTWFTLSLIVVNPPEIYIPPFRLEGQILISKNGKYLAFSNNIESDCGCMVCFEKINPKK